MSYDHAYLKKTDHYRPSNSLLHFFQNEISHRLSNRPEILETGCGDGSLFYGLEKFSVMAVDISREALRRVHPSSHIQFVEGDILTIALDKKFDLVFDAHLFHCLAGEGDLEKYLLRVKELLKRDGIFSFETMVQSKGMSFEFDQYFDYQTGLLYQGEHPVRKILSTFTIEKMLLDIGFKINFFKVMSEMKVVASPHRREVANGDPDLLRVIVGF